MTQESSNNKTLMISNFFWTLLVFSAVSGFFLLERITAATPASSAQVSHRIEGEGFDSPENAALAYLEGLRDLDLHRMISTFAVESYAENYDFEAGLNRVQVYQFGQEIKLPNANDFATALNIESRRSRVSFIVLSHYLYLCHPEFNRVNSIVLKSETDIRNFIAELNINLNTPSFKTLKILGSIPPLVLHDYFQNPKNMENMERLATVRGADSLVSCAAVFTLGGKEYILCLDAISYGGKWYISELGGNIGMLLAIPVFSMGTAPIPDERRDEIYEVLSPVK